MKQSLRECLAQLTYDLSELLSKDGTANFTKELTEGISGKTRNGTIQVEGNPFHSPKAVLDRAGLLWKGIVDEFKPLSVHLKNDNLPNIRKSLNKITSKCAELTTLLTGVIVEAGSYIPGPIGIVCILCLAISCFATGNVVGGVLNLLGCIPCAKVVGKAGKACAPLADGISGIIQRSGIERFSPVWTADMVLKYNQTFQKQLKNGVRELRSTIDALQKDMESRFKVQSLNILS